MTHTFTLSGLGNAPFSICNPNHPGAKSNVSFFCQHCGTMLKNRYFVLSADGQVSVVGIDCLKKSGDQGLIDGAKRLIKSEKDALRMQEIERKTAQIQQSEREHFNGKTRDELIEELDKTISILKDSIHDSIIALEIEPILDKSSFGQDMLRNAVNMGDFSDAMINVMKDIATKSLSNNARKKSPAYNAMQPQAETLVTELLNLVASKKKEFQALAQRKSEIQNWRNK